MSLTRIDSKEVLEIDFKLKVSIEQVSNWGETKENLKERFTSAVNDGTIHEEIKEFLMQELQGEHVVQADFYDFLTIDVSK